VFYKNILDGIERSSDLMYWFVTEIKSGVL
jgi:hypothetical protein